MIRACQKGDVDGAMNKLNDLWTQGYSAVDIVVTVFRVTKTFDECALLPFYTSLHATDSRLLLDCQSIQNSSTLKKSGGRICVCLRE